MEKIRVHGRAEADDATKKHSKAFDRALEDALANASQSGFEPGTHEVRMEFRAVMEVTNPGRIQSYIVSITKDDGVS
jgi:flagellar biosynthesis/type III secretory pathway protein FliH